MRLSVLNFFSAPNDALLLAKFCDEETCFHRFWVGEHHSSHQVADPLTLAIVIAGTTGRIRVGTGAVSLFFRSPYLVAETALLAEALFPGRIDLGVTRAAGIDLSATERRLLEADAAELRSKDYDGRVRILRDTLMRQTEILPFFDPMIPVGPPMFLMVTSTQRAIQAGHLGVGMVASFHHGGTSAAIRDIVSAYKANFVPTEMFPRPVALAVVSGFVTSDASSCARAMRSERDLQAAGSGLKRSVTVYGPPRESAVELDRLGREVGVDEILFLCMHGDCHECYGPLSAEWARVGEAK